MSAKDRRFWIESPEPDNDQSAEDSSSAGSTLRLDESQSRHAQTVLRCQHGDSVTLMDGAGSEWTGSICSIQKRCVEIQVESKHHHPPPTWRCALVQSWLKGKNMDWVIQKATELGVTDIVPMWTQRSEVRLKPKDVSSKFEKWNTAIQEACKQCGRFNAPTLHSPLTFEKSLKEWASSESSIALTAALTSETKNIRQVLEQYSSGGSQQASLSVSLWVGPEGDFTESEYRSLRSAGAHPIRLTPHILRSETAAVTGLAILINELTR